MKPMVIIDLEFLVPGRLCAFLIMIILIYKKKDGTEAFKFKLTLGVS